MKPTRKITRGWSFRRITGVTGGRGAVVGFICGSLRKRARRTCHARDPSLTLRISAAGSHFAHARETPQRFLRWILPLKESNLTEDAAFPMVPAKALPARTTKEEWAGCKGKSFSTLPW